MANVTQWIVRKSGVNYTVADDGAEIVLRSNGPSEANLPFDNTLGDVTGIFSPEDELEVYIGSVSAANKMMVGYNDILSDTRTKERRWEQKLRITDWGAYLAGKTVYESDNIRERTGAAVLDSAEAEIAGLATNITGLNSSTQKLKRTFSGTYVKDAFQAVVETCNGEFFIDETKTLQAFNSLSRDLTELGTGLIYKLKDIPAVTADTLMVEHIFPYNFTQDVTQRFRNVIASSGIIEGFPTIDPNMFQTQKLHNDQRGKDFSRYYQNFGTITTWDIDTTTIKPFDFLASTDIGGIVFPTVKLLIASTATQAETFLRGSTFDSAGDRVFENLGLSVTEWQTIQFFIKVELTGPTVNKIYVRLYDAPVGGDYWEREIIGDLIASGASWTVVRYSLPANTVDASSNGWTKVGVPTTIDAGYFRFENGVNVITGYTASSSVSFGQLQFIRRQRATVTAAGTPVTEKIIIDASMKSKEGLTNLATNELTRVNVVANDGFCTITGNQAFKKPGYRIQVDFTNTLGTGRSGTVRIDEIKHFLKNGKYYTEINFKPPFQRP